MPTDDDLGLYRYYAAGKVRLLIRARLAVEPDFLSEADRICWEVTNQELPHKCSELLCLAAGWSRQHDTMCGPPKIKQMVTAFSPTPLLRRAWQAVRRGDAVDWDALAQWHTLPAIRKELDDLPHPRARQAVMAKKAIHGEN